MCERVDDRSTSPHILVKKTSQKTVTYVSLDSYNISIHSNNSAMTKSDKLRLSAMIVVLTTIVALVIYNSIVYGIPRYPHDGM